MIFLRFKRSSASLLKKDQIYPQNQFLLSLVKSQNLFQPYGGFPDGVEVEKSFVTLPEITGIGFEGKSDLFSIMKQMTS